MHHPAPPETAIYPPDLGSVPPRVGIVVGAEVFAVAGLRLHLLWRAWRRRRR